MVFARLFKKPRWTHKDAATRADAVRHDTDEELIAQLSEIASTDPDSTVRIAALKRLDQTEIYLKSYQHDEDQQIKSQAIKALQHKITLNGLPEALRPGIETISDKAFWEALVKTTDAPTRQLAAEKLNSPNVWFQLILETQNLEDKAHFLKQISQTETLQKLLKKAQKSDKKTFQLIEQHILEQKILQGDPAAINQLADSICSQMQSACLETEPSKLKILFNSLNSQWNDLPASVDPVIQHRFSGFSQTVQQTLAAHDPETQKAIKAQVEHQRKVLLERMQHYLEQSFKPEDLETLQTQIQDFEREWKAALKQSEVEDQNHSYDTLITQLRDQQSQLLLQQPLPIGLQKLFHQAEKLFKTPVSKLKSERITALEKSFLQYKNHFPAQTQVETDTLHQISSGLSQTSQKLAQYHQDLTQAATTIDADIEKLELAVSNRQLKQARQLFESTNPTFEKLKNAHVLTDLGIQNRMGKIRQDLAELQNWLHWSNDKSRVRLCEELEAMAGHGMHPDAVAEKVRSAQAEWKYLDEQESLPGQKKRHAANPQLWKRFQTACNHLYKPAEQFFNKRADIQDKQLKSLQTLLESLDTQIKEENIEIPQLENARKSASAQLRQLSELPPRNRSKMAGQIRALLDRINARLDQKYDVIAEAKHRIIRLAERATEDEDIKQASEIIKQLQKDWKQAGHLPRKREQKLWKSFRGHCDAVFSRLQQQRDATQATYKKQIQAAEDIIAQLENSLANQDVSLIAQAKAQALEQWQELESRDKKLDFRFDQLNQRCDLAIEKLKQLKKTQGYLSVLQHIHICQDLSSDHNAHSANTWQEESIPDVWQDHLIKLKEQVLSTEPDIDKETMLKKAQTFCLQFELLVDVESPDQWKSDRMSLQLNLLTEKHTKPSPTDSEDEVHNHLKQWSSIQGLSDPDRTALQQRMEKALRHWCDQGNS